MSQIRSPFQLPTSVRSFYDYFKLSANPDIVLNALGYSFATEPLILPQTTEELPFLPDLQERLRVTALQVGIYSEIARREFLIAPILFEVARYVPARISPEYPIRVSEQLKGSLDYLLETQNRLLIVEAKHADMARGFTQMAAELVAVDQWSDNGETVLYGAVTFGDVWRFGTLNRETKRVVQDVALLAIPQELTRLCSALVGILQ